MKNLTSGRNFLEIKEHFFHFFFGAGKRHRENSNIKKKFWSQTLQWVSSGLFPENKGHFATLFLPGKSFRVLFKNFH